MLQSQNMGVFTIEGERRQTHYFSRKAGLKGKYGVIPTSTVKELKIESTWLLCGRKCWSPTAISVLSAGSMIGARYN